MDENHVAPDDINAAIDTFIGLSSHAGVSITERFAELQGERAARLAEAETRLKEHLGTQHPQVEALRRAASSARDLERSLQTTTTRESRLPQVKPYEWMVFGQVLDSDGKPVVGVTVRVFDRDRRYDDLLGEAETDEFGDFSMVYHERDFAEDGENLPELYLMVEDRRRNLLYSSRDDPRREAGRVEYFQIVLAEE